MVLQGHSGSVLALQVSSDGSRLFSASMDSTVKIWDFETGDTCEDYRFDSEFYCSSLHPAFPLILLETTKGNMCCFSWESGELIADVSVDSGKSVRAIKFSPDGQFLVSCSQGDSVWSWCTKSWKKTASARIGGYLFEFDASGKKVAFESECQICIWNIMGEDSSAVNEPAFEQVAGLRWKRNDNEIMTAYWDGYLRVWNAVGLERILACGDVYNGEMYEFSLSADGTRVAELTTYDDVRI